MRLGIILVIFLFAQNVRSASDNFVEPLNKTDIPIEYLEPEDVIPTAKDLEHYIVHMKRLADYVSKYPNDTDITIALTSFYTKSVLKRALLDDRSKLQKEHFSMLSSLIHTFENLVSHFIYNNIMYDWDDLQFKVSKLFQDDTPTLHSISNFNRNILKPFIRSDLKMNKFVNEMDRAVFSTENYANQAAMLDNHYNITIIDSDICIANIALNPTPIEISKMNACKPESCEKYLFSGPSIAYTLSHRLLNLIMRLQIKRCYIRSEEEDTALVNSLCGFMYREAVYLSRRGYFARDIFLEHVALCSMMGYEEFHRRQWFYKITSWINKYGCITESKIFKMFFSQILVQNIKDIEEKSEFMQYQCEDILAECQNHPTSLLIIVLSHAVRHAAHFMKP